MKINFYSKYILASLLCCIAVVFTSCDDIFASEDNPIACYLSMSDKDVTIKIGDTYKRTAIAVSGAVIEYTSSDETVATVDNEGTVTGVAVGDAVITATATGYNTSGKKIYLAESKTYNVKVNPILAQSVTINNPLSSALFDQTATFTADVSPANTTDKSIIWSSDNTAVVTVDENTGEFTALKAVGSAKITATAVGGAKASFTVVVGLLPGVFTVDNGTPAKKVQFAQGNLQTTTTDLGVNWTWTLAANQWSYVGNASANNKVNGNGSVYANGTLDLFCWVGASNTTWEGELGTKLNGAMYGITTIGDGTSYYTSTTNDYGNVAGENLKSDWGKIFDPSGTTWRTLTKDEWVYVLETRNASTIGTTDNARFAKAYLFGTTHGLIIFPDNYTHPAGVADPTGINQTNGTSWNANMYDVDDWAKMEAAGCVFLPAAGRRNTPYSDVTKVNEQIRYWSSKADGPTHAFYVEVNDGGWNTASQLTRAMGISVRLVYPAQ